MITSFVRRSLVLSLGCALVAGVLGGCGATPPNLAGTDQPLNDVERVSDGDPELGRTLFYGEVERDNLVGCMTCHYREADKPDSIGPNLAEIEVRGAERIAGLNAAEYIRRSIIDHDAYTVPGYNPGLVKAILGDEFGAVLNNDEIAALVAYLLQTEGGGSAAGGIESSEGPDQATPLPSESPTATIAATATTTPVPSESPTATIAATATTTPVPSQSPTATIAATATTTPPPTATVPPTSTPTAIATVTTASTNTSVTLPTDQPTLVPTATTESVATVQPTNRPTETPLPTPTAAPTATALPTPTLLPTEPPTAEALPGMPDEPGLAAYQGCISCHVQHP
ncbi:MAG: cytochrome c [Chloroflexia bacterium]|nr:cytochrome c [Chloroflexia bacterium]